MSDAGRLSIASSAEQLGRHRAIVERLKPGSRSQLALIECMLNQLDALDEIHGEARREPRIRGLAERLLWLGHDQVDQLQKALSTLVQETMAGVEAEATEAIVVDDLEDTRPDLPVAVGSGR